MPADEDMKKFKAKLESSLQFLTNQTTLSVVAIDLKNLIQRRTRLGFGVEDSGTPKKKLVPLAPSTIKSRQYKKGLGKLSELTNPPKSNLTETAAMLDSLKGTAKKGVITVEPVGDRNKKLAAIHTLGGPNLPARPFLNLAQEDIKQLTARLQDKFSEILDRIFKS